MSLLTQASLILTPNAYKAGKLYSVVPSSGNGDMTVARGTTATRVNSSGNIQTMAIDVPRLDYTGIACPNILLEPERINSVPNSTMTGASSAPSTFPTGWQPSPNGLTQTIVGVGIENGLTYIDVRNFGTATGGQLGIRTSQSNAIAAAQNQVWSGSVYVKIVAQPLPPTSYGFGLIERDINLAYLSGAIFTAFSNTILQRLSVTGTLSQPTTVYVQQDVNANIIIGNAYDFTIRIAGPQVELGAYTTSFIPTISSIVTRNFDNIFKTGIGSDILNPSEGTFYAEIAASANDLVQKVIQISDGSDLNLVMIAPYIFSNVIRFTIIGSGGTYVLNVTVTNIASFNKCLLKWGVGGLFVYVNGVKYILPLSSGSGSGIPTALTRLSFSQWWGGTPFYGKCKGLQVYKTALTDAQCFALTTL